MRLRIHVLLAAGCCLFSSGQLRAEVGRALIQSAGDCLVSGREKDALKFFVTPTPAELYRSKAQVFTRAFDKCVSKISGGRIANLQYSPNEFDAILAEGLARSVYAKNSVYDFSSVPKLNYPNPPPLSELKLPKRKEDAERFRQHYPSEVEYAYLRRFGECVVRADAKNVHGLVLSTVDSETESHQIEALKSAMDGCRSSETPRSISISKIRQILANNYVILVSSALGDGR